MVIIMMMMMSFEEMVWSDYFGREAGRGISYIHSPQTRKSPGTSLYHGFIVTKYLILTTYVTKGSA